MKIGTRVTLTRRNGETQPGKIADVRHGARGAWFDINIAEPRKQPVIVSARRANVQPAA